MTNKLYFLAMGIKNHPLLDDDTFFSLVADSRVNLEHTDDLTHLFGRIWVNNITALVGRNAAGKTLTMKLVLGVLSLLFDGKSISQTQLKEVPLGHQKMIFTTYLYGADGRLYADEIELAPPISDDEDWHIAEETILSKAAGESLSRKAIFDFTHAKIESQRSQLSPEQKSLLAPDDSLLRLVIARHDYQVPMVYDTLRYTDLNMMTFRVGDVPSALLEFLDPSIEYLRIDATDAGKAFYRLKFKNDDTEYTDSNFATVRYYLSSGAAKAITLYQYVVQAMKTGGIVFIDELENHFHHEIVRNFIGFFTKPRVNRNRATLIFSTHYAELLDDLDRGDQIYVISRYKQVYLLRYSDADVRTDLNRTDFYNSGYLPGTAPSYDAYMRLQHEVEKVSGDDRRYD
jgi:ABC-type Na+ transport system ATPase subunit NatA